MLSSAPTRKPTPPARMRTALFASLAAMMLAGTGLLAQQPVATPGNQDPVTPSTTPDRAGRQVSLRNQLRVGLKAATKADLAFIDLVVFNVDQGILPRRLVDSTFLWARNRYKSHSDSRRLRPMVYFQPALVRQAKKLGVTL